MKPLFFPFNVDTTIVGSSALIDIATREKKCTLDGFVVATMPPATKNSGQLCLFKVQLVAQTIDFLVAQACKHGCDRLADPHTLISFYRDNVDFVDNCPIMTRWVGHNQQDCVAHFDKWRKKRRVGIHFGSLYSDRWWVAAIVK